MVNVAPLASPLPASPTRGEVPFRAFGTIPPQPLFTSPLMGEAGRGWGSLTRGSK